MPGADGRERTTVVKPPPPRERGPLSLKIVGDGVLETCPLPPTGTVVIGRGAEADLQIDDPSLSRKHVQCVVAPDAIRVKDLGSANGTRVGDRALEPGESVEVQPGEVIDVGSVMVIVQRGYSAPRVAVPAATALREPSEMIVQGPAMPGRAATPKALRRTTVQGPAMPGRAATPKALRRTTVQGPAMPGRAATPKALRRTIDEPGIVVADPHMERIVRLVRRIAGGQISVLLLGETGVGKEVVAELVHRSSPRAAGPFLRLNCGGFSETLLESELFGHEKGAFTGAVAVKPGLLESADGGTVFLDEIGELSPALQVRLLRVLEDRQVMRVGALKPRTVDVRFVAATNRDLEAEVAAGTFREDLYYRISGITIVIPPLRERTSAIAPLARRFVAAASAKAGVPEVALSPGALAHLEASPWPGNIRELRNVIERAVLLAGGAAITEEHLIEERPRRASAPAVALQAPRAVTPLRDDVDEVERRRILEALEACAGNQTRAAKLLGIARNTLAARLEQFGIPRPRKK